MTDIKVTTIPSTSTMCVIADEGVVGAQSAFIQLESQLESPDGRDFYGVFDSTVNEYRACVAAKEGDYVGLKRFTIPGGKYARALVRDWAQKIARISELFDELADGHEVDDSRPSIEFYRSFKELEILLPIK